MVLPTPTRAFPRKDWAGNAIADFKTYADHIAVRGEKLFAMVPNRLTVAGGSADAIEASCDPPLLTDPVDGQLFRLLAAAQNTGNVTIDIDGRGAISARDYAGNNFAEGSYEAGEELEFRYDGTASQLWLTHRTLSQQVAAAAAAVGLQSPLERFGDSGLIAGTPSQVEFTFTAGRYVAIDLFISDVRPTADGASLTVTLRNSSGAILTLNTSVSVGNASSEGISLGAQFVIGTVFPTKGHYGSLVGKYTNTSANHFKYGVGLTTDGGGASETVPLAVAGADESAPDRVRFAFNSGNIQEGRIVADGRLAEF
jgi:hypothetical protein